MNLDHATNPPSQFASPPGESANQASNISRVSSPREFFDLDEAELSSGDDDGELDELKGSDGDFIDEAAPRTPERANLPVVSIARTC